MFVSQNREPGRFGGGIIEGMERLLERDPAACYRALATRDARFDGRLFVGVTSTGVYCRPAARREALVALAQAALADPTLFQPHGSIEVTVARLRAIRGIGIWTAHYIALRAVREADAFPASDIGLLRGASIGAGARPSPALLQDRAETWRPWRAYAAQRLWAADQSAAHD